MGVLNIEFKARTADPAFLEKKLLELDPVFIGEDRQVDTYFKVQEGRLKLREGNIENALIWYERPDSAGSKASKVLLYQHQPDPALKALLIRVHGIKVIVEKRRRIYFINNVKFHFDEVPGLGYFVEVEAIDRTGEIGAAKLQVDCDHYAELFGIRAEDYVSCSYSDLIKVPCSWY
jgi:predicted adenylyl cyclase CyaB